MEGTVIKHSRVKALDRTVVHILRPLARAYILGYASSISPRLLGLLLSAINGKKSPKYGQTSAFKSVLQILRGGLELQRFPTFCATLVGSYSFFRIVIRQIVKRVLPSLSLPLQLRSTRFVSAFLAGWLGLELLHSKGSPKHVQDVIIETPHGPVTKKIRLAGRTIDLTFFAVTRALDIVINDIWSRRKKRLGLAGNKAKLEMLISKLADPLIFSSSCTLIMFAWLYTPDRLPRAYNNWIKSAAAVDMRLLQILRQFRDGTLKYGTEKPDPNTLKEMCKDYKWPIQWSDHVKTIPVPCHVIHLKDGHNCEYHAIARLVRSFFWALKTYLPLNLILVARNPSIKTMKRAIKSAIRSSAFLGTFIALFFYGICLARSRIGPYVLGTSTESRQKIEEGINIGGGCLLCGWSVLVENPSRRRELGLFVAPRAMATIMPRTYSLKNQWKETLAFSLSTAVVFTAVTEKPNRVRGLLGKILQVVLVT